MVFTCKDSHRYNNDFKFLPETQGGEARHKCAGCAYKLGESHALKGYPQAQDSSVLDELPESQAGFVRHKDAFEAYKMGFFHGKLKKEEESI